MANLDRIGPVVFDKKSFQKWTDMGVQRPIAPLEKVNPDGKQNLRGYHCPDVSYQK